MENRPNLLGLHKTEIQQIKKEETPVFKIFGLLFKKVHAILMNLKTGQIRGSGSK